MLRVLIADTVHIWEAMRWELRNLEQILGSSGSGLAILSDLWRVNRVPGSDENTEQ
jgi:hypothetical protein